MPDPGRTLEQAGIRRGGRERPTRSRETEPLREELFDLTFVFYSPTVVRVPGWLAKGPLWLLALWIVIVAIAIV